MFELIVPLIFKIVGIGGLAYSIVTALMSISAKSWIPCPARILNSRMIEDCDSDGCTYEAKISYEYTYRAKDYQSSKIGFGYMANSIRYLASRLLVKYPPESQQKVWVNPKNPAKSVLVTGFRPYHLFNILFFAVFTWVALQANDIKDKNELSQGDKTVFSHSISKLC